MARVILGSYMVRYPLGGVLSSTLQWLVGFQNLGHEIFLVEKSGYPRSCFDPVRGVMSDDCSYGTGVVRALLRDSGLQDSWCYVDAGEKYHGMSRARVESLFRSADIFIDRGTHGTWLGEASDTRTKVLVDGEPGHNQMKMSARLSVGEPVPEYDHYFTVGQNIGRTSAVPTAGCRWKGTFHPVSPDLFPFSEGERSDPVTTVMNWKAHETIEFDGRCYGQKDAEFVRFMDLPQRTNTRLEIAIAGDAPTTQLIEAGWAIRNAHEVTTSFESYRKYIRQSSAEFSVAKQVFVATRSGWFSDRSAAYLACGRPVILQETGFSEHLPCGSGLFAVTDVDEAATAIEQVRIDYQQHSRRAREIALEFLDARVVVGKLLAEIGL